MPVSTHALLPIQIQGRWLALDALAVQEVLGERPWVPIPGSSSHIPGVMAWRGRAIAILDLGAATEMAGPLATGEKRARAVVTQVGSSTVALLVDAAREVCEVRGDQMRPPHATRQPFTASEVEIDGVPMPVVDLPAIVQMAAGSATEGV